MSVKVKIADLFCGAGGTTVGAESTGEVECVFAVNHCARAIDTHSANHPRAKHVRKLIQDVGPTECPKIGGLFASPSCTHHSKARGGRPTSDQQRSGAWEIMPWLDHHRPSFLVVENVPEFRDWGPVGFDGIPLASGKGKLFDAWIKAVQSHGYRTEIFTLNAADFGAATSRVRLFVVARKGRRAVRHPEPTHTKPTVGRKLPGFDLPAWRSAAEVIDWSLPCPSIFSRSRPLADKTLSRIEAGLKRFVGPYAVVLRNNMHSSGLQQPLYTITAGAGHHGLAVPFQYKLTGNNPGLSRDIEMPVPTIVACKANHGFCVPYLTTVNHGDSSTVGRRPESLDDTLGTVTAKNGRAIVVPFISQYYGTGTGSDVREPLPTIVTKDRHALVQACIDPCCLEWPEPVTEAQRQLQATMRELGVADIGFRMLQNHELAAAQGFPSDYIFHGTKSEITKQVGNSVSPPVAKAITLSLLG